MPAAPLLPPDDGPVSFPSMPTLHGGGASHPGEPSRGADASAPDSLDSMKTMRGRTTPRGERLRVGDVLLGRYTVLSELGQGGMGVVYKCLDNVGGIEVALKCLPPELSRNEAEMEGIRENYAIVARLHHPAISGLRNLEKDPDSGEYHLVMDLAEGENLSTIMNHRRGEPMPLPEALAILRPLASALDYAHSEKVLHRDVKPANVKVDSHGGASRPGEPRVQLLDFGLAAEVRSSMSRVSLRGHVGTSGTPAYMAPEQWEARSQSAATDQYALAVVAYQMLSGHLPFDADDPDLLRRAVLSRVPDSVPGLPRGANAALLRALAKDPAARFPSCGEFVEALSRAARRDGSPHLARPTRWIAVAAAVAVAVAGALWYTRSHPGSAGILPAEKPHAESAESALVLPPEGASLEELQSSRARFEEALDARRAEGWPDTSAESVPLLSAVSTLDTRIVEALEAQEKADREKESARLAKLEEDSKQSARAAVAAAKDEEAIRVLQAGAARDAKKAEPFRKWAGEGEFKTRFATLDERRKELDGFSKAADLSRAKDAAAEVRVAADWIADNAAAMESLDEAETSIQELVEKAEQAEASQYAKAALYRAQTAHREAVRLRGRSDFTEAKAKYDSARTLYEDAIAAATRERASVKAREALVDAEAAKIRGDWTACLAAAEKALEWERDNQEAAALKHEAETNLKPKEPKSGEVFRLDLGGSVMLEMVPCSGVASNFWMGKFEVTQEQWQRVMGSNPSRYANKPKNPVECVSWNDCQEFITKLNALPTAKASGLTFRLPTEDEWETACRAGSTGDYCKLADGTQITRSNLSRVAWFDKGWDVGPTEVGKNREPNAWGLYDMHGNVWEWTSTADGGARVLCGGGFNGLPYGCAAGRRSWYVPDFRDGGFGFRLAASGRTDAANYTLQQNDSAVSQNRETLATLNVENSQHEAGERKTMKVGSVEVALRWCPPGSFTMGSPSSEKDSDSDETQHRVTLTQGFWMGETEVTQALWQEVTGRNPSSNGKGGGYPVENVSWNDCQEFLKTLNARPDVKAAGLRFALPTEAQWEYACRAGTTGAYAGTGRLDDMGWYSSNSGDTTHPVGQKKPNAWGLHDMLGNVYEWCADWYGAYPSGAATDQTGAASGDYRVLRGGSVWNSPRYCRSASRSWFIPDYRLRHFGFRLAASGRTDAASYTPPQNESTVPQNNDTQATNAGNDQHKESLPHGTPRRTRHLEPGGTGR